jgi:hypothetical protein
MYICPRDARHLVHIANSSPSGKRDRITSAMDARIARLVRRLETADDPEGVALDLFLALHASADSDAAAADLAALLGAAPRALAQLGQLLVAKHAVAMALVYDVLRHVYYVSIIKPLSSRLVRGLAAAPGIVEALVEVLGSSTAKVQHHHLAASLVGALGLELQSYARSAVKAGAFKHLARLLRQHAGSAPEEGLLEQAAAAVLKLVQGSGSRAQQAGREGLLEALVPLLAPRHAVDTQKQAAASITALLEALPQEQLAQVPPAQLPPARAGQLQAIVRGMVRLLVRQPSCGRDVVKSLSHVLLDTQHQVPLPIYSSMVAAEVAAVPGAVQALVRLGRAPLQLVGEGVDAGYIRRSVVVLLNVVLPEQPQLLESACAAGLLDLTVQLLQQGVDDEGGRMIASMAMGVFGEALVRLSRVAALGGDQAAARGLAQLDELRQQSRLLSMREAEERASEYLAAVDSASSACASCGARARQPGVKLMACSRCRRVVYCSAECQRRDWREHKPRCSKQK